MIDEVARRKASSALLRASELEIRVNTLEKQILIMAAIRDAL